MYTLGGRVSRKLITTFPVGLISPSILRVTRRAANAPVSDTISASVSSVEIQNMMPFNERSPDLDLSMPFLPLFDHGSVIQMVLPFHSVICSSTLFCFGDVHVTRTQSLRSFTSVFSYSTDSTGELHAKLDWLSTCLLGNIKA